MMVFDKDWFAQYQKPLLRFANTRFGRYTLRVHGKRSGVGKRKIIKIEPHAITWVADDGKRTAEFRTHAKYSKRLYHAFKPLWFLMHAWDMAVANRLNESLNLGFDTLTVSPDTGYGSTTMDGYLLTSGSGNYSITDLQVRSASTLDRTRSGSGVALQADGGPSGAFNILKRAYMTFDTSSMGSAAVVQSAEVGVYGYQKLSQLGESELHITASTQASGNNLVHSDWTKLGTTFGNVSLASYVLNDYTTITLNSTGEAAINSSGITKIGAKLGWDYDSSFTGVWVAHARTEMTWLTADMTGASSDPTLTVEYYQSFTGSISGVIGFGASINPAAKRYAAIVAPLGFIASVMATKIIAPVPGKEFVYRVYDADGVFLGVWNDVIDEPEFSQRLGQPGTTTTVKLPRSADNEVEVRDEITTEAGEVITDETGDPLVAVTTTSRTVGEGTDVELNYRVDIYAHYGGFEELTTEDGELITTEDGESILVAVGAPLGRRIFSGFIMDYDASYGEDTAVTVTVASNGLELAHEIIKDGTNTTRTYSAQNHDVILKSILDVNPGRMTYDGVSIEATGVTISETFRLNTKLQGIESVYNQTPDGWYWFGDVAENLITLKEVSATADHTFVFRKHIKQVNIRRSIEDLRNEVYFVGGDSGGGTILFKKYSDATSQGNWRVGLHLITDRRFTVAANAQKVAEKIIARYKNPIYTTTVTIPSEVYDIETIKLGQMVQFRNFGNFVDGLLLQIVSFNYTPRAVTLELGELLLRQQDIVDKLAGGIEGEQYVDIPNAPA